MFGLWIGCNNAVADFTRERILNQFMSDLYCSGLQKYLNEQGFHIVGYGCTTCIGNSGELDETVASAISENGNSFSIIPFVGLYCFYCLSS